MRIVENGGIRVVATTARPLLGSAETAMAADCEIVRMFATASAVAASASAEGVASLPEGVASSAEVAEHESTTDALAVLNRERAKVGGAEFASAFKVYRPAPGAVRPGGDLDEPATAARGMGGACAVARPPLPFVNSVCDAC